MPIKVHVLDYEIDTSYKYKVVPLVAIIDITAISQAFDRICPILAPFGQVLPGLPCFVWFGPT